ncbi:MAG: DHHA1 domain-containing protein, partial [Oscillospiraceae bacterium]
ANEQVDFANSIGLDIIITDHHTPNDVLPNAIAAINPHRNDCSYPFKNLAGVGVVLKLISALEGDEEGIQTAYDYSYLAGIGTVADIVELKGENRAIVKKALESINDSYYCGVNALIDVCKISGNLSSTNIAFMLGPRINAAGRVGKPSYAVDLLMCGDDEDTACELAKIIDGYNIKRKTIENEIYEQVLEKIGSNEEILNQRVIIVEGENWDLGVIGIVCAKIVSKYRKPCILIGYDENEARGSARSVYGYDIIEAINSCSENLTKFGGHKMAAGFSLLPKDIVDFKNKIFAHAKENYDIMPTLAVQIDCKVDVSEINIETISELSCLEPYGEGNPHPIFLMEGLTIGDISPLSGGKHTKLSFSKNGNKLDGICFGASTSNFPYEKGDIVDVVISSDINEYKGNISVSNIIKDIKYSSLDKTVVNNENGLYEKFLRQEPMKINDVSYFVPVRDEIAKIYIYIRQKKQIKNNINYLLSKFADIGYFKMKIIVDILINEHLIEKKAVENMNMLVYVANPQKVDIENSDILNRLKKLV